MLRSRRNGSDSKFERFIKCVIERGFSVESEMQFRAREYGLRVEEVPITIHYNGETKRSPVIHGFSVLFRVIKFIWSKYFNSNLTKKHVIEQKLDFVRNNTQITEAENQ